MALLAWGLALAIVVFSYYVYVLNEQVNRAETLRQAFLPKNIAPAGVEQVSAAPVVQNVIGHPRAQAKARQDFAVTAISRP